MEVGVGVYCDFQLGSQREATFPAIFWFKQLAAIWVHLASLGTVPSLQAQLEQLFTSNIMKPNHFWNLSSLGKTNTQFILRTHVKLSHRIEDIIDIFVWVHLFIFPPPIPLPVWAEVMTLAKHASRCRTSLCCMERLNLLLMVQTSRGELECTPAALSKSARGLKGINQRQTHPQKIKYTYIAVHTATVLPLNEQLIA